MKDSFTTLLERRADLATKLHPFAINLSLVRNQVATILDEWKSSGIFYEYTDHSFAHVEGMLQTAEWIIPKETQNVMTSGDWLMLTLSIYLHDLGMLVTKDEFALRDKNSDYQAYKYNPLITSDKHDEYSARINQLPPDEAERVEYQEYVRASHGKRIRAWVEGGSLDDGGASDTARGAVNDLLANLDPTFRRDLASICESHTLGHMEAVAKFSVSKPYGATDDEEVNLQYVAVVLRTVDLLQITQRRAPTVLFQLINPTNPVSQIEWQKQAAVRTVRAAPARDRDGNVTADGVSSSIEVHATFDEPDGFFGLTSYLAYAQRELSASYSMVQRSKRDVAKPYLFPWRDIDDRGIDTRGFLTESYEFSLDQHKILDLLTGHTLYNNSAVVLRELTQNALDAVRLQQHIDPSSIRDVAVEISWDSKSSTLTVSDCGTGMSQDVIEKHLLTVGSSKYQDKKFRDTYPDFNSISRFGIGVLSAFMVSDDVEITTCSVEEDTARQIALQSVHGKYLIKLLDKVKDRDKLPMYPHGTSVRLRLRPLAEIGDLVDVAKTWIMFPRCKVSLRIDDNDPVHIGYESPKEAIEEYVNYLRSRNSKIEYKVTQFEREGLTLAYALSKSELFEDWTFVTVNRNRRISAEPTVRIPVATCIEGVSVESSTPGFDGIGILAAANAVGSKAPKTNVARTALEDTAEHREMLKNVYDLYCGHVTTEIERLASSQTHSLSRAVGFVPFIAAPLTSPIIAPNKIDVLSESLDQIPMILVEDSNRRINISLSQISERESFITIESPLHRSIEYFIREAPANVTTSELMKVLGNAGIKQPKSLVLCNMPSTYIEERMGGRFQVVKVGASIETRTLTLNWEKIGDKKLWFSSDELYEGILDEDYDLYHTILEIRERYKVQPGRAEGFNMWVPLENIEAVNLEQYGSFRANRVKFLCPGTSLAKYIAGIYQSADPGRLRTLATIFILLEFMRISSWPWEIMSDELLERAVSNLGLGQLRYSINEPEFLAAVTATRTATFDTYAWDTRGKWESF